MTDVTKTTIVNLALREIGSYRIDDFDNDPGAEAQVARDLFETVRREALSEHEWRFATRTVELARSAATPVGPFGYAYPLPADLITLGSVADTSTLDPSSRDFDVMDVIVDTITGASQPCVLTDMESVFISYTYDHAVIGAWPAWFVSMVSAMLASRMASALKSITERERLEKLAGVRTSHARSKDSSQQPVRRQPIGIWASSMRTRVTR